MTNDEPLTTPYTNETTAEEVLAGVDLTGKTAIVTGGSSGLGAETARVLANAGAEVTLAVRKLEAGQQVADKITGGTVRVAHLDLNDRGSIDQFAKEWTGPLHMLINNAGVMALPELQRTTDGWEQQFTTNHLAHFVLTNALHGALAATDGARVVSVSSAAHHRSPVVFDDINFENRDYDPWLAYAQSKTANILFAIGAAKRWADDGIAVNAIHPGAIYDTGLLRHVEITPEFQQVVDATPWKTVEQGAATQVFAAASPLAEGITGQYFSDATGSPIGTDMETEVEAYALDTDAADRLWDLSVAATK